MKRELRDELCALSLESFGSKYAWQSYLRTPYYVTQQVATNGGKLRPMKVAQWRTLDEVIALMKGKPNEPEVLLQSEKPLDTLESSQVQDGSGDSQG